jgi:hypothetical protein
VEPQPSDRAVRDHDHRCDGHTHFGGRYVFGELEQSQLTMTTRVSVIVTPKVSMQVFAQPLIAVGDYGDFKELARPRKL